jgi:hypothetical protein
LAVSANDNRIKILATVDGLRLMCTYESRSLIAAGSASETVTKVSLIKPSFIALNRKTFYSSTFYIMQCAISTLFFLDEKKPL